MMGAASGAGSAYFSGAPDFTSCNCLVFRILSFDCSFWLIAWYFYIFNFVSSYHVHFLEFVLVYCHILFYF